MRNNLFVAYIVGIAGVVLIISGVRGTTPLVTLQSLLRQGKLPEVGQTPPGPTGASRKPPQVPRPGAMKPLP